MQAGKVFARNIGMSKEIFETGRVDYLLPGPPSGGSGVMSYEGGGLTFGESAEYPANVVFGDATLPVTLTLKRAGGVVHAWVNADSLSITPQGLFLYGSINSTAAISQTLLPPSRASLGMLAFVQEDLTQVVGYVTANYQGVFTLGALLAPSVEYFIGGLDSMTYGLTSAYLGSYLA